MKHGVVKDIKKKVPKRKHENYENYKNYENYENYDNIDPPPSSQDETGCDSPLGHRQ